MLAIACDKCRRRYTVTDEELRVYLERADGKKYAQVLCPHCGKPSKVSGARIHQALRFSPPPASDTQAAVGAGAEQAPAEGTANLGTPSEEVNPGA